MNKSFLITLLFLGHLYASSFNCDKATTSVEKSICSSLSLSQLDDKMSIKYTFIKKRISKNENKIFLKAQRQWLKEKSKCETNSSIENCLISIYQDRILEFEDKYNTILFDYPAENIVDNICTQLAKNPKLFIHNHKVNLISHKENNIDINNDDRAEQITIGRHNIEYTINNRGRVFPKQVGFNDDDRWTHLTTLLNFDGKIFNLYTFDWDKDRIKPKHLTYINQANKEYFLCRFNNKIVETMIPNKNIKVAQELCPLIDTKTQTTEEDGSARNYIEYFGSEKLQQIKFTETSELNNTYFQKKYDSPWVSYKNKEATFDYDNDGKQETIIVIKHPNPNGRYCDAVYFDELNLNEGSSRKQLLKIQGLDISSRYPPCGQNNIFFKYKDMQYYEERGYLEHNIFQIKDNKISTVCTGSFNIVTSVAD